jgi:RHS repeat-associated protein
MQMPGRKFSAGTYRYGFNGKENDTEVKGEGNQQDYGMRPYDTRLGRLISVDPLTPQYPFLTPYQFAENNPIENIDFLGMQGLTTTGTSPSTTSALSNWSVGSNGRLTNSTQLLHGPINSGAYTPQTKFISQAEFVNMVPPYGGATINASGTSVTVFGANGTSWQESLLKPVHKVYTVGDLIKSGDEQFKTSQQAAGLMNLKNSIFSEKPSPLVIKTLTPLAVQSPAQDPANGYNEKPNDFLYRGGSFTDLNFTPRPGKDDGVGRKSGWSTFTTAQAATQGQGGKVQVLSVKILKRLGFQLEEVEGHVGIRPKSQAALKIWAKSREDLEKGKTPHLLTKILKKARVSQKVEPKK